MSGTGSGARLIFHSLRRLGGYRQPMPITPATLRTVHALLDMVVAYDPNDQQIPDEAAVTALDTAFERLNDVGAMSGFEAEGDDRAVELEATPLLTAISIVIHHFADRLSIVTGEDKLTLIAEAREVIDLA